MIAVILCGVIAIAVLVYLFVWGKSGPAKETRQGPRLDLTITVQVETPEQSFTADSQNISLGGMLLRADAPVSIAQPVHLSFRLPETTEVQIPAVVCHKRGEQIGVRFDPTHQRRIDIEKWLRSEREERENRSTDA